MVHLAFCDSKQENNQGKHERQTRTNRKTSNMEETDYSGRRKVQKTTTDKLKKMRRYYIHKK